MKFVESTREKIKNAINLLSHIKISRSATADYAVTVDDEESPRLSVHIVSSFAPTLAFIAAAFSAAALLSTVRRLSR